MMSADEYEQLLRVSDVAERCKISVGSVYAAIQAGKLKAARLGSRKALRIKVEEMEKWIQNTTLNTVNDD